MGRVSHGPTFRFSSRRAPRVAEQVVLCREPDWPSVDDETADILQHVIRTAAPKTYPQFIRMVYSTYPIVTQPKFSHLDMVKLANEYKESASTP